MRSAFIKALIESARESSDLWLLTADLGYSFLEAFEREFPQRFVNVGVAEQNMMLVAAGLALTGKKVVVYSIINFATFRALEQIRNSICYHQLDVVIVGVGAGYFYGSQGYSHHCIEDLALMRAIPSLQIYSPMDARHTEWITKQVLLEPGPTYLRLGRNFSLPITTPPCFSMREALLIQEGKELMILTLGEATHQGMMVAQQLQQHHLSAGVMTFPRVQPIDGEAIVRVAQSYPLLVIIEEHVQGGLATIVAEILMQQGIMTRVKVFQMPVKPLCTGGSAEELLHEAGLSAEHIVHTLLQVCV